MNLTVVRDDRPSISVMSITDIHAGAKGCLYGLFEGAIQRALRERMHVIVLGDLFDSATTASVTPWADEELPLQQAMEYIITWLGKLAEQHLLDAIVGGNHRRRIYKFAGLDIEQLVADTIHVPFFTASGVVEYRIGRGTDVQDHSRDVYTVYMHHTARGGRTAGAPYNALEALTQLYEGADFYCGGHTHKIGAITTSRYSMRHTKGNTGVIVSRQPWLVACGSFLEWQDSYAEETQLSPSPPGYAILRLPTKKAGAATDVDVVRFNTDSLPRNGPAPDFSIGVPHDCTLRMTKRSHGPKNGLKRKVGSKRE